MSLSLLLAIPLALPGQVSFAEFPIPTAASAPQGLAVGSDGAIWFTEAGVGGASAIGRIDSLGVITEYPVTADSRPQQITVGPDGNLYFTVTNGNYIGQLTPSGVFTQMPIPNLSSGEVASPTGITVGHDGNIWFTLASPAANAIESVTTAGAFSTAIPLPPASNPSIGSVPTWITVGPDNNIWFTEQTNNKIGTVRSGVITEYSIPTADSGPFGIVAGPGDGNLWFTERNVGKIGKINATTGAITDTYALGSATAQPLGITQGADGALWFTESALAATGGNKIGRITAAGVITDEITIPTTDSGPYGIIGCVLTIGPCTPDHALWFTEDSGNKIGRISAITFESFAQVPGALTQVSVGADGTVWGINGSQQVFAYDNNTGGWTLIPGALASITVGSSTGVWGLNAQESIYHWDSVHSDWIQIPGSLKQIAVGADGDVWGLNFQANIYHYSAQTNLFSEVQGSLTSIVVGSAGAVYGLNSAGSIYWYDPGTGYFEFVGSSVGFTQIAVGVDGDLWGLKGGVAYHYDVLHDTMASTGRSLTQLAVGSGAEVFGVDGSDNIWQWDATSQAWVQLGGNLTSVAAGANGTTWGVNSSQEIFQLLGGPLHGYQTLNTIAGATLDQISVGADGSVWGVSNLTVQFFNRGTQTFQTVSSPPNIAQVSVGARADVWAVTGCHNPDPTTGACPNPAEPGIIYQYDASTGIWNTIPGELNLVQVGADGSVWGINAAGQTFTYNVSTKSWTQIPGQLGTLSVGADGTVWGINGQLQVYQFDGVSSWVNVPGSLSQISVGNANNVWGVNAQGQVYYYDNGTKSWVNIPGALLDEVWVSFDGAVWGTNSAGNVYQWNATTRTFNFVGSNQSYAIVGNAANVWSVNATTGAVSAWF